MAATPAQIEANRKNAKKSTGPKSEEGKARSRANALKHGMTGAGIVLPRKDAAEVERLADAFRAELKPAGAVGEVLVRRMAVHAVRMDRLVVQETAALTAHVREAVQECRPHYLSEEETRRRRAEAGNRALFDASPQATLARRYEAASERAFHLALNELRRMRAEADRAARPKPAPAKSPARASAPPEELASFFQAPRATVEAPAPPKPASPRPAPALPDAMLLPWETGPDARCDIPMAIGRAR